MVKKEKEEEKIEKIIRNLLKLPENRRCINCNSLGPQYVCTTFLTFVCTNCSGVHREFTHRVKSVSMAKFSTEEVSALQTGGNERARQIYFKEWDAHRNSYPDGSNLHRLRDFIKHVYVERKYTGERSHEKLRKLRVDESIEPYDGIKSGIFYGRSPSYAVTKSHSFGLTKCSSYEVTRSPMYEVTRSPSFDDKRYVLDRYGSRRSVDKNFKNYYDEMRSPHHPERSQHGGFKRSPVRFEVVDDRYRDDENGRRRPSDTTKFTCIDSRSKSESMPPDSKKSIIGSKSAGACLAKNIPPTQIEKQSKINEKVGDGSTCNEVSMPSSQNELRENIPIEGESQSSEGLIDFSNKATSHGTVAPPQAIDENSFTDNSTAFSTKRKLLAPKPNTVEFLLFELSIPSTESSSNNVSENNNDNQSTTSEFCITSVGVSSDNIRSIEMSGKCDNVGPLSDENATSMHGDNVPTPKPLDQMSVIPNQGFSPMSVPISGMNETMIVRSSTLPLGQISESFSSVNASTTESKCNKFTERSSPDAPYQQSLSLFDGLTASSSPSTTNLTVQPISGGVPETTFDLFGGSSFTTYNTQKVEQEDKSLIMHSVAHNSTKQGQPTSMAVGEISNQPCTSSHGYTEQGPPVALVEHTSQQISQASQASQESDKRIQKPFNPSETKYSGRQELPVDLFATSFISTPGPTPNWHIGNPYNIDFGAQYYHNPMQVMSHPNPTKSTNPFDLSNDNSLRHIPSFPSMEDLRGASFDVPSHPVLFPSSSMGHISSAMIPDTSQIASQYSPFRSMISSGPYIEHQAYINSNTPSRSQEGGYGFDVDPFASLNVIQHRQGGNSFSTRHNSLPSRGGNPFG